MKASYLRRRAKHAQPKALPIEQAARRTAPARPTVTRSVTVTTAPRLNPARLLMVRMRAWIDARAVLDSPERDLLFDRLESERKSRPTLRRPAVPCRAIERASADSLTQVGPDLFVNAVEE